MSGRAIKAAVLLLFLSGSAHAADADIFQQWIFPGAPTCVPVSKIKAAGAEAVQLTPRQFEFVRALYVAIPPTSHTLPPGDKAFEFRAGGVTMIGLANSMGGATETCARFLAPDFIVKMLDQVAIGATGDFGDGL